MIGRPPTVPGAEDEDEALLQAHNARTAPVIRESERPQSSESAVRQPQAEPRLFAEASERARPRGPRPWNIRRVASWAKALAPVLIAYAVLVTSGVVLLVHGGGDGSFFRCDVAAASFSLASFGILAMLAAVEFFRYKRHADPRKVKPWGRWQKGLKVLLEVNAMVFFAFALLAHEPWYLVQITTLFSMSLWTVCCCSIGIWAWRKGVTSDHGDPPLVELLLSLPRWRMLLVWFVSVVLSFSIMFFKPREKLGFDPSLGRLEHFLFTNLGSVLISGSLSTLGFCLLPSGRSRLVFQGSWVIGSSPELPPEWRWEAPPRGFEAFFRAFWLAWLAHFIAVGAMASVFYIAILAVVLGLVKYAIINARPTTKQKKKAKEARKKARAQEDAESGAERPSQATSASDDREDAFESGVSKMDDELRHAADHLLDSAGGMLDSIESRLNQMPLSPANILRTTSHPSNKDDKGEEEEMATAGTGSAAAGSAAVGSAAVGSAAVRSTATNRKTAPKETVAQKKIREANEAGSWKAKLKRYGMMAGIILFGMAKVGLMFFAFLFDVVFIQKALAKLTSASFILVKEDFTCGRVWTDLGRVSPAESCARLVMSHGHSAFAYGTNTTHAEQCYMEETLVVNTDVWESFTDQTMRVCPIGDWVSAPGLDFYAIEPERSCTMLGNRRLTALSDEELLEDEKVTYPESGVDRVPDAIGNMFKWVQLGGFGDLMSDASKELMKFLQSLMDTRIQVPRDAVLKCTALRRLVSAIMIIGAVFSLLLIAIIDLLSILSAAKEIAGVRAGDLGNFLMFVIKMAKAGGIEQLVLGILQVSINALGSFRREAMGVFKEDCGYLAKGDIHLFGTKCPNTWAPAADFLAIALLFFGLACGLILLVGVFSGGFYGLAPARWIIVALFGKDLSLSHFAAERAQLVIKNRSTSLRESQSGQVSHDGDVSRSTSAPGTGPSRVSLTSIRRSESMALVHERKSFGMWLLQPIMGFLTSFGIWTTWTSRGYQVGRRQDWYEPLEPSTAIVDEADDTAGTNGELVSWKSMYQSTSKAIALAWLPLPYGNVLSKGALYMNEYVIFAFGKDGGGSDEDPDLISHHFTMDTPQGAQVINWCTYACQFAILIVINFDLLPTTTDAKLIVLTLCVIVVILIACLRVGSTISSDLTMFRETRGNQAAVSERVEARVPEVIVKMHKGEHVDKEVEEECRVFGVDLKDICDHHKQKTIKACTELIDLEWIVADEPQLSKHAVTLLRTPHIRKSRQGQVTQRLLKDVHMMTTTPSAVTASLMLLLHEAVNAEIQQRRSSVAARQRAKALLQEAAEAKGVNLQRWAEQEARQEAVNEATARILLHLEAERLMEARRRRGLPVVDLPPIQRWVTIHFSAAAEGKQTVTAQWSKSSRELVSQDISATVSVKGEVGLTWTEDLNLVEFEKGNIQFAPEDVKVSSFSHQIYPPVIIDEEPTNVTQQMSEISGTRSVDQQCIICLLEGEASQPKGCCKGCCSRPPGADHHDLEGGRGADWQLIDIPCEWDAPSTAHNMRPGRLHGEEASSRPGTASSRPGTARAASDSLADRPSTADQASWVRRLHGDYSISHECTIGTAWVHEVTPAPVLRHQLTHAVMEGYRNDISSLQKLERELLTSLQHSPDWLAGAFLEGAGGGEAAKQMRAQALITKMVQRKRQTDEGQEPIERKGSKPIERVSTAMGSVDEIQGDVGSRPINEAAAQMAAMEQAGSLANERNALITKDQAMKDLTSALSRVPPDADELSSALDNARHLDVDPLLLKRGQDVFAHLVRKQQAALSLVQARESKMIKSLRKAICEAEEAGVTSDEFPNDSNIGLLALARQTLEAEESNAGGAVEEALRGGGAMKLLRAVEQLKETSQPDAKLLEAAEQKLAELGRKKHGIALLKMAMQTENVGLLKAAIQQCEKQDSSTGAEQGKIDLDAAKAKLAQIEKKFIRRGSQSSSLSDASTAKAAPRQNATDALKQFRANASLQAALYQDPPEASLLRLAIAQARVAGMSGPDLGRAEALAEQEEEKEHLLGDLRAGCAARDTGAISHALNRCRELGVDQRKLLTALTQLIEEQAKVARAAGNHGIGNVVLASLERERRDIHNRLQEAHGGLRVLCRVRPLLPEEEAAAQTVAVTRVDKHTITVRGHQSSETFRVGAVFGPDCIQAEVWSEVRGLVQSAADGYNVSFITCGPQRGGKTFTMLGSSSDGRGMMPRIIDELWQIKSRDSWRTTLDVDAQLFEIYEAHQLVDLLAVSASRPPSLPGSRPGSGVQRASSISSGSAVVAQRMSSKEGVAPRQAWVSKYADSVESMVTRRIGNKYELRQLVEEAWRNPQDPQRARHITLSLCITRANQATGATTKSRLTLVDLAGMGHRASEEVRASYTALQDVLKALAMQEKFVPWRRHKLTESLQDCMGGNAKTILMLALPPSPADAEDSLAGVAFASCGSW